MSHAEAVSLYLQAEPAVSPTSVLVHEGGSPAVPELADLATADERLAAAEATVAGKPSSWGRPLVRRVPSRAPGGRLIRVAVDRAASDLAEEERRSGRRAADRGGELGLSESALWLGLRFAAITADSGADLVASPVFEACSECSRRLLALGATLADHCRRFDAVLRDPVTGLTGRTDFQAALKREVESASAQRTCLTLMLVNPDDFLTVNERFGREAGDTVMREIARRLTSSLRHSDLVHRYGGAVFSVLLTETHLANASVVARKVYTDLVADAYFEGALVLGFSLGLAAFDPAADESSDDPALELLRRADLALAQARLPETGPVVAWESGASEEVVEPRDRLSGIFTADQAKDYRNMLVLWDTVNLVAASASSDELAARVVDRIDSAFSPDRIGLFLYSRAGEPKLLKGVSRRRPGSRHILTLDGAERAFLERARTQAQAVRESLEGLGQGYAAPLLSRGENLGCLYLSGRDAPSLDASDLVFLEALASQVAAAFDRIHLAERERFRQEEERRRLEAELDELRHATRQAQLIYRSPQMTAVLDTVRRVAPTDATVLVTGPSGTGKELVARTIHELSPRRSRPLVVVDCGAIAAALIDSELFGHEKGAYTGAGQRTLGRLAEADGGTLILDEAGELPLDVQSKLLRFVQEKQLTPVGGVRTRTVDVRLVAVTNRDLAAEVAAGRFREDLYHRLNVVRVTVPRLSERPDDIPALVEHFQETFTLRYGKAIRGLTPEAGARVRAYPWPGNVRELQNRILQAVILCEGDLISAEDLGLDSLGGESLSAAASAAGVEPTGPTPAIPKAAGRDVEPASNRVRPDHVWKAMRTGLRQQVEAAIAAGSGPPAPLGRWLAEDLVREAYAEAGGVASRGAAILGIPETTFRRRLRQTTASRAGGPRSPAWEALRPTIAELVRSAPSQESDLVDLARQTLVEEISAVLPDDLSVGAALLGVTVRTFRRFRTTHSP